MAFLLAIVPIPLIALATLVFLAGGIVWPNQPPPPPSPWTIPFAALLGVNVVALVTFATRSRTYGWWLLIVTQGVDLIVVLAWLALLGPWSPFYICLVCSTGAIGLLLAIRFARPLQA